MSQDAMLTALLALVESQDLRRRAIEGCREWLRSSAEEGGLRGWSTAEIELHFDRCAFVFDHAILAYPFIETKIGLSVSDPSGLHFRGLKSVGHYRLITRLDGTEEDDYFVLDVDKHAASTPSTSTTN